jgi:hypothetical protein
MVSTPFYLGTTEILPTEEEAMERALLQLVKA